MNNTITNLSSIIEDTNKFILNAHHFISSIKKKEHFNIIEYSKNKRKFDKCIKIKVIENNKKARDKWKQVENHTRGQIKGNYGILTGEINNIFVLDVDNKEKYDKKLKMQLKHGIEEFNKYIAVYGDPNTFKVQTPGGGYHYYFNFKGSNTDDNYLIKNYLTNKSGYRFSCLDIRSNGGYIVGPGSKIYKKEYTIINDNKYKINDMPSSLINFLLESQYIEPKNKDKKEIKINDVSIKSDNNFQYVINDDQLKKILDALDPKYLINYNDWLKATTALKHLNKFEIWDEWSKKSDHYDKNKNMMHWNYNKGVIDINYLITEINKTRQGSDKIEFIPKYKPLMPITTDISKIKKYTMNHKYLYDENNKECSFNYDLFKDNETIIIKSCTGTGKTTATAKHCRQYMTENPNIKLFTITDKITLSDQHYESFNNNNINIVHYRNINNRFNTNEEALTVCINSIRYISTLEEEELNNYIIYIDEISSFLNYTHNNTLDKNIKDVHINLTRIIKHAHKIVLSDALIKDNVFEFIKYRNINNILYVENKFLKYQDVPAVRVRDEDKFLNLLYDKCNNEQFFLFGADSCEIVSAYFHKCKEQYKGDDKEQKFILITSDTKFKIENASEQFNNKFVFYSPKIVTAVDFSIDIKQDVFIYIKGHTIDPAGSFQQTTRTRNIKTLYFYSESKEKTNYYNSLEELETHIINNLDASKEFLNLCTYVDEDDELKIIKNMFYNLYIYNEYVKDIYSTNKTEHYKLLLIDNGFNLTEDTKAPKTEEQENNNNNAREIMENIREEIFNEYLNATDEERSDNDKYMQLRNNLKYLNIENVDNELLNKFKDIIINKYNVQAFDNFMRYLKDDNYINNKLDDNRINSYDIKSINSIYSKIKIISKVEKQLNIKKLDIEFKQIDKKKIKEEYKTEEAFLNYCFPDEFYNLIKKVFRLTVDKPTSLYKCKQLYINLIKHISYNGIINAERTTQKDCDGKRIYNYSLNNDVIQTCLELDLHRNKHAKNFDENMVKQYNIISKRKKEQIQEIERNNINEDLFIDT